MKSRANRGMRACLGATSILGAAIIWAATVGLSLAADAPADAPAAARAETTWKASKTGDAKQIVEHTGGAATGLCLGAK
jgi:hypothetical protein